MGIDWKRTTRFLLTALAIFMVLIPISYLLSTPPELLLLAGVALLGLVHKRKQLSSTMRRAKAIVWVVMGVALLFGFILWYVNNDTGSAVGLIIMTGVIVILSFGLYD